jgi:hypothetical protein
MTPVQVNFSLASLSRSNLFNLFKWL